MTPADATERQLAVATESIRQLRADVELATAERDAEAARAFEAETERDALRTELAAVRRAVQTHDNARRTMTAHEVARLDALPPEERQAAIDDASRAWLQALEEARHWNEAATNTTEQTERARAAAQVLAQAADFARAAAVYFAAAAIAERKRKAQPREDSLRMKGLLLELLKALRPPGLRPDLTEWDGSVWGLLYLVREHSEKALKDRDTLRTLLRSILGAWEEAPASHRHEVSTLLPSLAQALQAAREGRNAEWWTRE